MKRITPAIAALALVAWACGGSGGDSSTTTAGTSATTTTAAAVTTTAAAGTTTTEDAAAARVAAAQALEGDYGGDWNNTTFNSTGSIEASLTVNAEAAFALLTIDLGGNVFGASDPDPFLIEIDLTQEGPYEGTSDLLGDYTVEVDDAGHVTITAPDVPGLGLPMTIDGDAVDGGFAGTYSIEGLAEGTWSMAVGG